MVSPSSAAPRIGCMSYRLPEDPKLIVESDDEDRRTRSSFGTCGFVAARQAGTNSSSVVHSIAAAIDR